MSRNKIDPAFRTPPPGANIIDYDDADDFEMFDDAQVREQTAHTQKSPTNINPLRQHFRIPGISIQLPSGLYFYKNNEIETSINNEIDVYPMTTGDELLLKNPDALFNGRAIELLIQSCVPQVNNVRALISQDLDVILLAIRAASSDSGAVVEPKCPNCGTENRFELDLSYILGNVTQLTPPYIVKISNNLTAEIRPYNFAEQTKAAITAFEQSKKAQHLVKSSTETGSDESNIRAAISETMTNIIKVKYSLMANSIQYIKTGEEIVTDKKYINEFLENAPKLLVDKLVKAIEKINNIDPFSSKPIGTCAKCNHQWELSIEFNPSSFFA